MSTAALGETSLIYIYIWFKLTCNDNFERVVRATTLPSLVLGGPVEATLSYIIESL